MKLNYRPEIDGLRTIAILAVIVYHAEIVLAGTHLLKGGFFGVDIFFVISGFLITSIIINEYNSTQTFSLLNFYERRARRLLPALFTVILVTIPLAWYLLYPTQLEDFAKSILSSLAFGSNFYWDLTLQEYGAESALLKPFLHTWSLAVEEQYYLFFPLILLAIYKYCKSHIIIIFTAMLLFSLQFADYITSIDSSFSFYMLPSRFWELLAGGLLANILHYHPREDNNALLSKTMPILGLFLITHSLFFIEFDSKHPGFITLLPVIGTVLIIWFANKDELVTKLLSTRSFVGIGLVSYSLYLWHYPIFSFGRIIESSPSLQDKALWIVLTFLLSFATYKIVENPFRNRIKFSSKKFSVVIGLSALLIFSLTMLPIMSITDGYKQYTLQKLYGKNVVDNKILLDKRNAFQSEMQAAPWGKNGSQKIKLLIIGNSHGKDTFNSIIQNETLNEKFEVRYTFTQIGFPKDRIRQLLFKANKLISESDVIMVSTRYYKAGNHEVHDLDRLDWLIKELKKTGKDVVVTSYSTRFKYIKKKPIFDWFLTNNAEFSPHEINKIFYENIHPITNETNKNVKKIALDNDVLYLDKADYMCNDSYESCYGVTDDGYKAFCDFDHYTVEGAKFFGKKMADLGWLDPLQRMNRH